MGKRRGHSNLVIVEDAQALGRLGAELFLKLARTAIQRDSLFTVALSGGNTPRVLYQVLATSCSGRNLPWGKIHLFWSDERNVPENSPDSNFHMASEAMLAPLEVPNGNIHRVRTELGSPEVVAQDYESTIRTYFKLTAPDDKPCFDLVLLGLGGDGHTASLFPDGQPGISINIQEPNRLVIAPWVPHLGEFRFSLTPGAINHSSQIIFLVSGIGKAKIIEKIFEADAPSIHYPASAICPVNDRLTWILDRDAAGSLSVGSRDLAG